jgi:hypothetical protein
LGPEKLQTNNGKEKFKPIRNSMLGKSYFKLSVNLEAISYLAGLARDVEGNIILNATRNCGRIFSETKKLQTKEALLGGDLLIKAEVNAKLDTINELINDLPPVAELWDRYASNDPKNNFCNLIERIRNRVSTSQSHLIRIQNLAISEIKKQISTAKTADQKHALIDKLNILQDSKIHDEKPSKHFLDIAKKGNPDRT